MKRRVLAAIGLAVAVVAGVTLAVRDSGHVGGPAGSAAICDNAAVLTGPSSAPAGAVIVTPGGTRLDALTQAKPAGTTFYLLAGTHMLGTPGSPGPFDQVIPKDNNVYIGAPGAVLDGQNANHGAFTQQATGVRISYLTIQHFAQLQNEGVVNHDGGNDWVIDHTTIANNGGAAMMSGARQQVVYDCLSDNGQYGINAYQGAGGITGLVIDHTEIARNNTDDWENKVPGCGCTGGLKLWATKSSRLTNNWIHDNKSVGVWADGANVDVTIDSNLIEANDSEAIFYEISYNGVISNNILRANAIVKGKTFAARSDNFPVGAVYISESGGDARVSPGAPLIDVHDNTFDNNWSGVTVWENADRFCGSGELATLCTLVNATATTATTCNDPAAGGSINAAPYYNDCRWKSQNIKVHNNTFNVDLAVIGCTNGAFCARQAVLANYGTYPSWSPYKAWSVADAVTSAQGNVWSSNTYTGPWQFLAHDTGRLVNFATWQGAAYSQDAGSTLSGAPGPTTTTTVGPTTTTTAPTTTTTRPATDTTTTAPRTTTTLAPTGGNYLDLDTAGLEGSSGRWTNWYSATATRSVRSWHAGAASLRISVSAPYGWGIQTGSFPAGPGPATLRFWSRRGGTVGGDVALKVRWLGESGAVLRVDVVSRASLGGSWTQSTAAGVAPVGTTGVSVALVGAGPRGSYLYLDQLYVGPRLGL